MEISENFSKVKVLVVGDVMLDRYWWGSVNRISPEAPVPVVNLENTSLAAGGAANVAANIAGLGAEAFLVGIIGEDAEADFFPEILAEQNVSADYLIKLSNRRTTIKTRVIAHSQQIVRIDQESKVKLSAEQEEIVWNSLSDLMNKVDIIIVSDYAKGAITENILSRLITSTNENNKSILIDPKGKNYLKYRGATLLTPNRYEVAEAKHLEDYEQTTIETAGEKMRSELSLKGLLITQGEAGMTLFEEKRRITHLPVTAREVYDVTGAGDTVIAALGVAIGAGASFTEAAMFANKAAGLVVGQIGTTAISLEMLKNQSETPNNSDKS
ncbi:MAG: D-glycero-beta-D-manno-heptose-7-phosphate kinase [Pyrinomonadaceae bacterium]